MKNSYVIILAFVFVLISNFGFAKKVFAATDLPITSGLRFHVDATDINGDGIIDPSPINNTPVLSWVDKSDYGNTLSNTSATTPKPTLLTNVFGTKPGVNFAGNVLDFAANGKPWGVYANTIARTEFVVFKLNNTTQSQTLIGVLPTGQNSLTYVGGTTRSVQLKNANNVVTASTGNIGTINLATPTLASARYSAGEGDNNVVRLNRTLVMGSGNNNNNTNINLYRTGAIKLGSHYSNANPLNGVLAEVIVYNRTLTNHEIEVMECYLASKWSVATTTNCSKLSVKTPTRYQTYQRNSNNTPVPVVVEGKISVPLQQCTKVVASYQPNSFVALGSPNAQGFFSGTINLPTGQHTLSVGCFNNPATEFIVPYVTVGDVYVIAGQSNAEGKGQNQQVLNFTGIRPTVFTERDAWKIANDPVDYDPIGSALSPSTNVNQQGKANSAGSPWPHIASSLINSQAIPIGYVTTALGGQPLALLGYDVWSKNSQTNCGSVSGSVTILQQTQPQKNCYLNMLDQINQSRVGKVKSVLWFQGEADYYNRVDSRFYSERLKQLSENVSVDVPGNPKLMVGSLGWNTLSSYIPELYRDSLIQQLSTVPTIVEGPVTYDIGPHTNDPYNIHFYEDTNIQKYAQRWTNALKREYYAGQNLTTPKVSSATFNGSAIDLTFSSGQLPIAFSGGVPGGIAIVQDMGTAITPTSIQLTSPNTLSLTLPRTYVGGLRAYIGGFNSAMLANGTSALVDSSPAQNPVEPIIATSPFGPSATDNQPLFWIKGDRGMNSLPNYNFNFIRNLVKGYPFVDFYGSPFIYQNSTSYGAQGFNGFPRIVFSSQNQNFTQYSFDSTTLPFSTSNYTLLLVMKPNGANTSVAFLKSPSSSDATVAIVNGSLQVTHGSSVSNASLPVPISPTLVTARFGDDPAVQNTVGVNGITDIDTNTSVSAIGKPVALILGKGANGQFFDGEISEALYYPYKLSDTDLKKVESYLAMKYALPIGQNFGDVLDSSGNIVWNMQQNAAYSNNVFALGRDDKNDFDRNHFITLLDNLRIGGVVSPLTDGQYIAFGNNALPPQWEVTPFNTNYKRLERTWKISNIGSVGNMIVGATIFTSYPDFYLVVDQDPNFTTSPIMYPMTFNPVNSIWSTTATLPHGSYITFATSL